MKEAGSVGLVEKLHLLIEQYYVHLVTSTEYV